MTPPIDPVEPEGIEMVRDQLKFSWHGNGCATNVDAEDGGGYCSSNCRQYQALEAFDGLVRELEDSRRFFADWNAALKDRP